jgi:hypothetical protein
MKKVTVILFALSCSIGAIAQNRIGELLGFVVDPQRNFVAGATVRALEAGPCSNPCLRLKPTRVANSPSAMSRWATSSSSR